MNKEILYDKPRIVLYHDVLTPEECKDTIDQVPLGEYNNATGFNEKTGTSQLTPHRTNSTYIDNMFRLITAQQRMTKVIEEELIGNSVYTKGCIESPFQIQRYAYHQQYKAHIDFFNVPNQYKGMEVDRFASAILYLNDDFKGGETYFTALNIEVKPRVGSVLFFRYDYEDFINFHTIHAGMPVSEGAKYIVTTFIRTEPLSSRWNPKQPSQPQ